MALYTPAERRTLSVRPGITSLASVRYRHEERLLQGPNWESRYRNEVLPAKLAIELEYLQRRTLALDLRIILATIASLVNN